MENINFIESTVKMPLMDLPVQSVVVELSQAKVLISPGSRMTEKQFTDCSGVTDIVAPNLFHHAGLPKAMAHYPKARVWGVPGSREKCPELKFTELIFENRKCLWSYQEELPAYLVAGIPKVNEVIFFHRKSKALILTDLAFNMQDVEGLGAWLILSLFGTYRKFAVSRFLSKFVSDKTAFIESLRPVLAEDFENIIVSHGRNIIGNGKEKLQSALKARFGDF